MYLHQIQIWFFWTYADFEIKKKIMYDCVTCSMNLFHEWDSLLKKKKKKILFIFFEHTKTDLIFFYICNFFITQTDLIFYKTKTIFSKFSKIDLIYIFFKSKDFFFFFFFKNKFDFYFINKPIFFRSQKQIWFFINQIQFFFY